jgi:hypothetical protein
MTPVDGFYVLCRPRGTRFFGFAYPPLKRWAIIFRPASRDWASVGAEIPAILSVHAGLIRPGSRHRGISQCKDNLCSQLSEREAPI